MNKKVKNHAMYCKNCFYFLVDGVVDESSVLKLKLDRLHRRSPGFARNFFLFCFLL